MYFTHDQLIKAISWLHPNLLHGREYLVLMPIQTDGTPIGNAWIERWPVGVPQPTTAELYEAYNEAVAHEAAQPTPVQPVDTQTTPLAFLERFTEQEQLSITAAAMQSPQLRLWYDKLMAAQEVVYADPRVAAGLDALVAAGLITQARSEEILPLSKRSGAIPQL